MVSLSSATRALGDTKLLAPSISFWKKKKKRANVAHENSSRQVHTQRKEREGEHNLTLRFTVIL